MAAPSFFKRVAVTTGTFVAANALSNVVLFPGKKLDYGILNYYLYGPGTTKEKFWSTRLQHVATIALPLAFMDHLSVDMWNKVLLKRMGFSGPLSFAGTPGPLLVHGFTFALSGIMIYVAADAYFNPLHEGKDRMAIFNSKWYPEIRGCHTMWVLPVSAALLSGVFKVPVPHGTLLGLIPPTLAFITVKGHSMPWPWVDNLTPHEKSLNAPAVAVAAAAPAPAKA